MERAPAQLVEEEREKLERFEREAAELRAAPRRPRHVTANGYLESLAPFGMKLGLERITALLDELGIRRSGSTRSTSSARTASPRRCASPRPR